MGEERGDEVMDEVISIRTENGIQNMGAEEFNKTIISSLNSIDELNRQYQIAVKSANKAKDRVKNAEIVAKDAKKGAELLVQKNQNKVIFEDKDLKNAEKNEILVKTDGAQPLKATIVWTDPSYKFNYNTYGAAHNNRTSKLVNDLDLRITNVQTNEVHYPWKLDVNAPRNPAAKGDNTVDNVEQVLIDQPAAGVYKIEVSNKGTLVNNDGANAEKQTYSIIVTGYTEISSPEVIPAEVSPTLLADGNHKVHVNFVENINSIKVFDMSGRLIRSIAPSSVQTYDVDFSGFPAGIYVLTASSANHKLSKKIRKQ